MSAALVAERPRTLALESGDQMSLDEFRRRYNCRPDIKKAELIDGVVYVSSPVRFPQHADPHGILVTEFGLYRKNTYGVVLGDNATWHCPDLVNEVQPDTMLRRRRDRGGTSWLDSDGYVCGVPELCAEVSASSASYDLNTKKALYARLGVLEYLVWQTEDGRIDWWRLEDGAYVSIAPDGSGILHSTVFAGLTLHPGELLALAAEADEEPGGEG